MGSNFNLWFVLFWVAYVMSASVYIFSRGFLLSRDTLPNANRCYPLPFCESAAEPNGSCLHVDFVRDALRTDPERLADFCLPSKSRVILFVVDALKYEFGLYDAKRAQPIQHYENKLPVLQELLLKHPERTRLMRFTADPPTTTLQRLKALTTGSLPTFIDVGSNFATGEIDEDNIVDQLRAAGGRIVFMGDSTWSDLYPGRFERSHPMASFNIYDLDTVDRTVEQLLPGELQRTDWQLLVAHTLGVDHCGHKHGPTHPEMARKLGDMDRIIRDIAERMDAGTTLLVIGDHGMTRSGDHGGDSPDETDALLFAYTRAGAAFQHDDHWADDDRMQQIDLVPTLAALLGIAVPYSSLGQINYNLLPTQQSDQQPVRHEFMAYALQNMRQMRRYQKSMGERSDQLFSESQIAVHAHDYRQLIDALRTTAARLPSVADKNDPVAASVIRDFHANHLRAYADKIHREFSGVWVQFDSGQMSQGLLFLSIFCLLIFMLVNNIDIDSYAQTFSSSRCILLLVSNVVLGTTGALFPDVCGLNSRTQASLVLSTVGNILLTAVAVCIDFETIVATLRKKRVSEPLGLIGWLTRVIFVFSLSVCFSNSFIVNEQHILAYALLAMLAVMMYGIRKTHLQFDIRRRLTLAAIWRSVYVRLLMLSMASAAVVRVSHALFRCREEQGNCSEVTGSSNETKGAATLQAGGLQRVQSGDLLPVIIMALFVCAARLLIGRVGTLHGSRPAVCLARYGSVVLGAIIGLHFVLARARNLGVGGVSAFQVDLLAWAAYAAVVTQLAVLVNAPLLVNVHNKLGESTVQKLFRQVRDGWKGPASEFLVQIPLTEGLSGAYTSVFLSLLLNFGALVAVVLGAHAFSGVVVVCMLAMVVLVLSSVKRFETGDTVEKCLKPEFGTLIAWTLLAHYAFYVTWHQPTLSQINWHAAFVGRQSLNNVNHSDTLAMFLVLLNTFGASLLVVLQYPLLCLFGFALYAHFPRLIPRVQQQGCLRTGVGSANSLRTGVGSTMDSEKADHELARYHTFELDRGELTAYENENALFGNVFRTGMLLIVLQGARVFASMLACTIHCRHLMVWKIFAPRFIYEGLISYAFFVMIPFGYLVALRIHASIDYLLRTISLDKTVFDRFDQQKCDFGLRWKKQMASASMNVSFEVTENTEISLLAKVHDD